MRPGAVRTTFVERSVGALARRGNVLVALISVRARLVRLAVLVAYLAFALGIPIPASQARADKDQSRPYPCQDRPCGCRSAEQCWTSCCCTTPAERVAWALERGVPIPAYAVLPSAPAMRALLASSAAAAARPDDACCCTEHDAGPMPCCAAADACHAHAAAPVSDATSQPCCGSGSSRPTPASASPARVIGILAAHCQGQWSAGIFTVPHIPSVSCCWSPRLAVIDWVRDVVFRPLDRCVVPPVPPPIA